MDHKKNKKIDVMGFYKTHKIKLIIALVVFILICLAAQLFIFYNERMVEGDLSFDYVMWSDICAGKIYTIEEKEGFCNNCSNDPSFNCQWPIDMQIRISKVETTIKTGGEIHCYLIIDGVNYYTEKGRYFGITNSSLFSWEVLPADKPHKVEFCCGIARESVLTTLFGMEKKWPQTCIEESVSKRCDTSIYNNQIIEELQ